MELGNRNDDKFADPPRGLGNFQQLQNEWNLQKQLNLDPPRQLWEEMPSSTSPWCDNDCIVISVSLGFLVVSAIIVYLLIRCCCCCSRSVFRSRNRGTDNGLSPYAHSVLTQVVLDPNQPNQTKGPSKI